MRHIIRLVLPVAVLAVIAGTLPVLPTDIGGSNQLAQFGDIVGGSGGALLGGQQDRLQDSLDGSGGSLNDFVVPTGGSINNTDPFYFQVVVPQRPIEPVAPTTGVTTPTTPVTGAGSDDEPTTPSPTTGGSGGTTVEPTTGGSTPRPIINSYNPILPGVDIYQGQQGQANQVIQQQFNLQKTQVTEVNSLDGFVSSPTSGVNTSFDLSGCIETCNEIFVNATNECNGKSAKEDILKSCLDAAFNTKAECEKRCRDEAKKQAGSAGSASAVTSGGGTQAVMTPGRLQIWIPENSNLVTLTPSSEAGAPAVSPVVLLPGTANVSLTERPGYVSVQVAPVTVQATKAITMSRSAGAVLQVEDAGDLLNQIALNTADTILDRTSIQTESGVIVAQGAKTTAFRAIAEGFAETITGIGQNVTQFFSSLFGGSDDPFQYNGWLCGPPEAFDGLTLSGKTTPISTVGGEVSGLSLRGLGGWLCGGPDVFPKDIDLQEFKSVEVEQSGKGKLGGVTDTNGDGEIDYKDLPTPPAGPSSPGDGGTTDGNSRSALCGESSGVCGGKCDNPNEVCQADGSYTKSAVCKKFDDKGKCIEFAKSGETGQVVKVTTPICNCVETVPPPPTGGSACKATGGTDSAPTCGGSCPDASQKCKPNVADPSKPTTGALGCSCQSEPVDGPSCGEVSKMFRFSHFTKQKATDVLGKTCADVAGDLAKQLGEKCRLAALAAYDAQVKTPCGPACSATAKNGATCVAKPPGMPVVCKFGTIVIPAGTDPKSEGDLAKIPKTGTVSGSCYAYASADITSSVMCGGDCGTGSVGGGPTGGGTPPPPPTPPPAPTCTGGGNVSKNAGPQTITTTDQLNEASAAAAYQTLAAEKCAQVKTAAASGAASACTSLPECASQATATNKCVGSLVPPGSADCTIAPPTYTTELVWHGCVGGACAPLPEEAKISDPLPGDIHEGEEGHYVEYVTASGSVSAKYDAACKCSTGSGGGTGGTPGGGTGGTPSGGTGGGTPPTQPPTKPTPPTPPPSTISCPAMEWGSLVTGVGQVTKASGSYKAGSGYSAFCREAAQAAVNDCIKKVTAERAKATAAMKSTCVAKPTCRFDGMAGRAQDCHPVMIPEGQPTNTGVNNGYTGWCHTTGQVCTAAPNYDCNFGGTYTAYAQATIDKGTATCKAPPSSGGTVNTNSAQ